MSFGDKRLDKSFDEWVTRSPPEYYDFVSDNEVASWMENEKEILLYVCSECGLICSELINHRNCGLQDWWHLNVKCFEKKEQNGNKNS